MELRSIAAMHHLEFTLIEALYLTKKQKNACAQFATVI